MQTTTLRIAKFCELYKQKRGALAFSYHSSLRTINGYARYSLYVKQTCGLTAASCVAVINPHVLIVIFLQAARIALAANETLPLMLVLPAAPFALHQAAHWFCARELKYF